MNRINSKRLRNRNINGSNNRALALASINVPKIRKITKDKIIKDVAVVKTEETLDTTKWTAPAVQKSS